MAHPLVVHCKVASYDVYVGRGLCPQTHQWGHWGNPIRLDSEADRIPTVYEYARYFHADRELLARAKEELRGQTLGCWCAPRSCHGDVQARWANSDGIRVVVTGGRKYRNATAVWETMDRVHARFGIAVLIQGAAEGVDTYAQDWAVHRGIQDVPDPITDEEWDRLGNKAGPMRNRRMLDRFFPELLVAFPGYKGTPDMIRATQDRGLPIVQWDDDEGLNWITDPLEIAV